MNEIYSTNAVKILNKIDNYNNYIVLYTELDHNYQIGDIVYLFVKEHGENNDLSSDNDKYKYKLYTYLDSLYLYNNCQCLGFNIIYIDNNKIILDINYENLLNLIDNSQLNLKKALENNYIFISKILTNNCYLEKTNTNIDIKINCTLLNNTHFYNNDLNNIKIKQAVFINIQNELHNMYFINKYDDNYLSTNYQLNDLYEVDIYNTYNNNKYGYNYFIDININIFNNSYDIYPKINSGIFINTNNSIISNIIILNGYYLNYNLHNAIIEYAYCKECNLYSDFLDTSLYIWKNGIWEHSSNGFNYIVWKDGIWLNGDTPSDIHWYNGTFNYGTFNNSTWDNGVFNNGVINNSIWKNGIFNNGKMYGKIWYYGELNGGELNYVIFNNGIINNGIINNYSTINYCVLNNGHIYSSFIKYCICNNGRIEKTIWTNGILYDGTFIASDWKNGTFYDGYFYSGSTFHNGIIHNGKFENSILIADNLKDIVIEFCNIKNTYLKKVIVNNAIIDNSTDDLYDYIIQEGNGNNYYYYYYNYNGDNDIYIVKFSNLDNCIFNNCTFNDGIITGESLWYNGSFNYGIFDSGSTWYNGKFYNGVFKGIWVSGIFYDGEGETINEDIKRISNKFTQYNENINVYNNKTKNINKTYIDNKGRIRNVKKQYNTESLYKIKKTQQNLIDSQNASFEQIYLNLQNLNNTIYNTSSGSTS